MLFGLGHLLPGTGLPELSSVQAQSCEAPRAGSQAWATAQGCKTVVSPAACCSLHIGSLGDKLKLAHMLVLAHSIVRVLAEATIAKCTTLPKGLCCACRDFQPESHSHKRTYAVQLVFAGSDGFHAL